MMSKNERIFLRIPKGSNDFKDARVFKGRGNLILSLLQNKYHLDKFFHYYDILGITSVNTKQPEENFKELIENWKGYKESKEDENTKIVREKELFKYHTHSVEGKTYNFKHQNWP